jgi:hypothetical protein
VPRLKFSRSSAMSSELSRIKPTDSSAALAAGDPFERRILDCVYLRGEVEYEPDHRPTRVYCSRGGLPAPSEHAAHRSLAARKTRADNRLVRCN